MERLWSPWRSHHVASSDGAPETEGQTLFARLAAANEDDANLILWRGAHVFVLLNLYPYNNGHLMIVPYRAVADYDALSDEEQVEIARVTASCMRWLRRALAPHGFNVGMNLGEAAGAGIPDHLHVHIVPRWRGDTNFMPAVGQVKVIPEALRDTYQKLLSAVAEEEGAPR